MMTTQMTAVLADIGGTNTRVALGSGPEIDEASVRRYRNADWPGIGAVLLDYLSETGVDVQATCVAMAGPVRDGAGRLTNLDWEVNRDILHEATGADTLAVLNDLQAQGHAVGHIDAANLTEILPEDPRARSVAVNTFTLAEVLTGRAPVKPSPEWEVPSLEGVDVVVQPHCHQYSVMGYVADRDLLARAQAHKDYLSICTNAVSEALGALTLVGAAADLSHQADGQAKASTSCLRRFRQPPDA